MSLLERSGEGGLCHVLRLARITQDERERTRQGRIGSEEIGLQVDHERGGAGKIH